MTWMQGMKKREKSKLLLDFAVEQLFTWCCHSWKQEIEKEGRFEENEFISEVVKHDMYL